MCIAKLDGKGMVGSEAMKPEEYSFVAYNETQDAMEVNISTKLQDHFKACYKSNAGFYQLGRNKNEVVTKYTDKFINLYEEMKAELSLLPNE